jgi:beta-lactamase class A
MRTGIRTALLAAGVTAAAISAGAVVSSEAARPSQAQIPAAPMVPAGQAAAVLPHLRADTAAALRAIASRVDGVMSYDVVDLTSGDRFAWRETTVSATASTIKLAILYELYRQADERRLRLDEAIPFDRRLAVAGSGVLFELATPVLTVRDYATLMIVLSDNSATNVLIDRIGMANVTSRMRELGLPNTKLRRAMMDLEAARRGDENVSTAREIALLLEHLHRGTGLSAASRDDLLAILKKEKDSALVRGIPAGVPIASKPGELEGVRVDAGIVYAPNRPYIISVMLTCLAEDTDGDRAIEEVSRVAYGYFSRIGMGSEYGRIIGR